MPGGAILTSKDIVDGALTVALSKVGVRENPRGSNSGPEVDQFLASVRLLPGQSWCASFVYYCYARSVDILSASFGAPIVNPCPQTGSVLRMWELIDARFKSMVPRRGSLYFVDHGNRKGHVGFVVDPDVIQEVSGNTNQEGSREGDSVWLHSFKLTDESVHGGKLLGFVYFG